jgi:hypothetical protein
VVIFSENLEPNLLPLHIVLNGKPAFLNATEAVQNFFLIAHHTTEKEKAFTFHPVKIDVVR